uniref:Cadherin domain-containing protein n=1 Tax=Glossina pallidipes TaxID=7398 RepID=A0A1A9ZSG8_GLOPL
MQQDAYAEPGQDSRNIAGLEIVVIVQDVQDQPPVFTMAPPVTKLPAGILPGDKKLEDKLRNTNANEYKLRRRTLNKLIIEILIESISYELKQTKNQCCSESNYGVVSNTRPVVLQCNAYSDDIIADEIVFKHTKILQVHAEDGDKGSPREVRYGLVSEGNPFTSFFDINDTSGSNCPRHSIKSNVVTEEGLTSIQESKYFAAAMKTSHKL